MPPGINNNNNFVLGAYSAEGIATTLFAGGRGGTTSKFIQGVSLTG